jgi:hypothetical protein
MNKNGSKILPKVEDENGDGEYFGDGTKSGKILLNLCLVGITTPIY